MEKMYRVLLACGNEDYGKVLASTFQLTDRYIVAGSAKDGAEALDMLRDTRPDFLVMDLMLQKTDGMSVLKAAAALDRHPVMLVLVEFVTEYISSMFMELGVQYIMLKPCTPRAIIERLDEIRESLTRRRNPGMQPREANIEAMVTSMIHEIGVHQGLSISARGHHDRGQRHGGHQRNYKGSLSAGRQDLRHNALARGACDSARD